MDSGAQRPPEPVNHPTGLNRRRFLAAGAAATVGFAAAACSGGGDSDGNDEGASDQVPEELNRVIEDTVAPGASGSISVAVASRTDGGAAGMSAALGAFGNPDVEVAVVRLASALLSTADPVPLAGGPADIMRSLANPATLAELVDDGVITAEVAGAEVPGAGGDSPLVPFSRHGWGVFYRPSVFESEGFAIPTGLSELLSLGERMDGAGVTPFATANAQGWESLGWFDTIGLRLNGAAFHDAMLAGEVAFNDDRVAQIFVLWQQLAPFLATEAGSRTLTEAAAQVASGNAAMLLAPTFVAEAFGDETDLDFFAFPSLIDELGTGDLLAPLDGFVVNADVDNPDAVNEFVAHLASPTAQEAFAAAAPGRVPAAPGATSSNLGPIAKRLADEISSARALSNGTLGSAAPQFTNEVAIPAIGEFVEDPSIYAKAINTLEEGRGLLS